VNRPLSGLFLLAALAISAAVACAGSLPAGIRIVGPEQVLENFAAEGPDGHLYLLDADGVQRRFVTSIEDPVIRNQGDGRFHPLSYGEIEQALLAVEPQFLGQLSCEVLLLPYPVADPLTSWASDRTIYLSPGVIALSVTQVHQLVAHEVGHVVHQTFLPDSELEGWDAYREVRGITDTARFCDECMHRDRPHEIFAEDFRILFGGSLARYDGTIENGDLASPEDLPGVKAFFQGLIGSAGALVLSDTDPRLAPNPVRPGQLLRLDLPQDFGAIEMRLYSAGGREVRVLRDLRDRGAGRYEITWDGRDDAGRPLAHGVYYGRIRSLSQPHSGPLRVRLVQ
jgi:hypothetical protein